MGQVAMFSLKVVRGRPFADGVQLGYNSKLENGGMSLVYRKTQRGGSHVVVYDGDGNYVDNRRIEQDANYKLTIWRREGLKKFELRMSRNVPYELEKDPLRLALRDRGIYPSKSLIKRVKPNAGLIYEWTPVQDVRSVPVGARCLAFVSDGDRTQPMTSGEDEGPIVGKVEGGTFLIQYSTKVTPRGKIDRWIEKIVVRNNIRPKLFATALDSILKDTSNHPEALIKEPEVPEPDPEPASEDISTKPDVNTIEAVEAATMKTGMTAGVTRNGIRKVDLQEPSYAALAAAATDPAKVS